MTNRYVHSYVSVAKNSNFLRSFASTRISNGLHSPTLFRWYAYTFFVQSSRSISRIPSPWSLRDGIFQLKQHSRVASGVVLTSILESVVGQKPGKAVMRATEANVSEVHRYRHQSQTPHSDATTFVQPKYHINMWDAELWRGNTVRD